MAEESPNDRLRIVLVNTRNPLNIGAAARAMSNFGFGHLRVVNPYELAFREARSAVGAAALLKEAEEFQSVAEAVADCTLVVGTSALSRRNLELRVLELEKGVRLLRKRLRTSRVAVLFGSEKRGLSNQDLSHCNWLLHIPTFDANPSMNLGQAVAVCLYEIASKSRTPSRREKTSHASAGELERLTLALLEALHASGYLKKELESRKNTRSATPSDEKIRRFVRRLHLSSADAELFLGMLRQFLWKQRP